jgi:hypothetical protein
VWQGAHAAVEDELADILRPKLSRQTVGEIVQTLYARHAYSPTELAAWSKNPGGNPYKAQWHDNHCFCGGNPSLHANYVRSFVITEDPATGMETISWLYPTLLKPNYETLTSEVVRGPLARSITRTRIGPLSDREIGRHALLHRYRTQG